MSSLRVFTSRAVAALAMFSALALQPAKALVVGPQLQPANSAGFTQDQIKAATAALLATLDQVQSSQVAEQLRSMHQQMATYRWRTVYSLGWVPKENLPGQRLAMTPDPALSQLNAESFYAERNIPVTGGFPAMNCPVAILGGDPGRPITYQYRTPLGTQLMATLSDEQIQQLLLKVSPDKGARAWAILSTLRNAMCIAMYNTAQLSYRYERFKTLQANLDECTKNGLQVTQWRVKEEWDFPGGYHRTAQVGGGVTWKCGALYKGDTSDAFTYDSWFKWSDDSPVPLNLAKQILGAQESGTSCPTACIDLFRGAAASGAFCVGVSPNLAAVGSTVPLRLGARIEAFDRTKHLCTPTMNIPAPFGLAESMTEMGDNAKQELMKKMQDQLLALFPINTQTMEQLRALARMRP